jgi:hypothetical protein
MLQQVSLPDAPPPPVRAATAAWVTAVGAGVVETIGTVAVRASSTTLDVAPAEIGTRAVIYTVVLLVIAQFWRGHRWARTALALGLGVVGMLSLVADPIGWLIEGNSLSDALASADLSLALVIAIRTLHVAAVVVGCALMFRPVANRYFRHTP